MSRDVRVAPDRLTAWLAGFVARNGEPAAITGADGATTINTVRGGRAVLHGAAASSLDELPAALLPSGTAALVLVRRGGYCIGLADIDGPQHRITASKTGTRYVQGRTAAGGQSQQRFARRRANQANALADAAAAAARTVLGDSPAPVDWLITGGDPLLLRQVLEQWPLRDVKARHTLHVQVGEPRRRSLDEAIVTARTIRIVVDNAPAQESP